MHQELAIQGTTRHWAMDALADLKEVISAVKPHESGVSAEELLVRLDTLITQFPGDYDRLQDVADLLFSAETAAYGARATAVFNRWEQEDDGGPSLPAFVALAVDRFNLQADGPESRSALMAAVLAEIPNDLLYHGNEHYRKVMFHTIRLLATHRQGHFAGLPDLDDMDVLKVLIAATIHDLGHEGGDNLREGIYTPGYMEQKAFDMMRPYFETLGLDREFWGDIETIIFCTDITFFAGDNSPCARMKKIYRHHFLHDLPDDVDVGMMMIGKLRRFENSPRLALMAMLLHEADIATSSGLSYEQSRAETISIMEERGMTTAGPKVLLRFLIEQLNGCMITPAAQLLFGKELADIMKQAEDDLRAGVESYYD